MTSISSISKEQLLPNSSNANQPFVILSDSSNETLPKQTPTTDMKRPPLKDVGNTKISVITEKKCPPKINVSQKEQLLNKVKLQWTTGKGRHQTSQCLDTIRECLKNDIPRDEINAAIVSEMRGEAQVIESRRAERYMLRARKSKTGKDDVEEVATIQSPFQRNECFNYTDEDSSKDCRVIQSDSDALVTPSNSSEEADTVSEAIEAKSDEVATIQFPFQRNGCFYYKDEDDTKVCRVIQSDSDALVTPSNSSEVVGIVSDTTVTESGMQAHLTTLLGHSSVKDETAQSDVITLKEKINEDNGDEVKVELMSEIESEMKGLGI